MIRQCRRSGCDGPFTLYIENIECDRLVVSHWCLDDRMVAVKIEAPVESYIGEVDEFIDKELRKGSH